jgi:hypothetical protein
MAKCIRCGKRGLFFKVDFSGRCAECIRLVNLELEEQGIRDRIDKLNNEIIATNTSLHDLTNNRDLIYDEISTKAKSDALFEIAERIAIENQKIQSVVDKKQGLEEVVAVLKDQILNSERAINLNVNKVQKFKTVLESMQYSADRLNYNKAEADKLLLQAEELLSTTVKLKFHLMDFRELRKRYNQNNKIIQELLVKYQSRYTTKANITIYNLMVIALEAEFQNVLYNLKYAKLDKAIKDIKVITAKYENIAIDGNQSIASTVTKFIGEIEHLFIEAIKIEYEYYVKKERMKEEQKAIRAQMRQEAAELKLLAEERRKIELEENKYMVEISNIQAQINQTEDQIKIQQLQERLSKVMAYLEEVDGKKHEIIKLQNGKAGYVYIISNIGSFGKNVFKIGMTRRLDPQDRIDELGDASVPFRFDVHSFIFSNHAQELELNLHRQLHVKRVNKINLRKEFFVSTIDELEELVFSLEPSAEFNRTMLAEHYYQSMAVDVIPDYVSLDEEYDETDEELN